MKPEEIGSAIRAFRSSECQACGGEKARRDDPFCTACLERLPERLRQSVCERSTYIESFKPAISCLKGDDISPTH